VNGVVKDDGELSPVASFKEGKAVRKLILSDMDWPWSPDPRCRAGDSGGIARESGGDDDGESSPGGSSKELSVCPGPRVPIPTRRASGVKDIAMSAHA